MSMQQRSFQNGTGRLIGFGAGAGALIGLGLSIAVGMGGYWGEGFAGSQLHLAVAGVFGCLAGTVLGVVFAVVGVLFRRHADIGASVTLRVLLYAAIVFVASFASVATIVVPQSMWGGSIIALVVAIVATAVASWGVWRFNTAVPTTLRDQS